MHICIGKLYLLCILNNDITAKVSKNDLSANQNAEFLNKNSRLFSPF